MKKLTLRWYLYGLAFLAGIAAAAALWHGGYVHYALALSGDPARQYEYGRWLDNRQQTNEARVWMEKAAEYDVRAMFWMGMVHMGAISGYFAYPDDEEAFWYFKSAADRLYVPAMPLLASQYESSKYIQTLEGSTSDVAHKGALAWYMRAANEGVGIAIDRLIQVYEKGELGENVSKENADMWRSKPRKNNEYWQSQSN